MEKIGTLLLTAVALVLFYGWVVMLAWNWSITPIFELSEISYGQGIALHLLGHVLFDRKNVKAKS